MVPTLNREPHAVFACLSTTGVLEQNMNISCYGRKMLRDEQVCRSNHRESDKTAALAVRRISAKRTQASFGRARQRLGSVTRPSVEKFPVFFLLGLFCYSRQLRLSACSQNRPAKRADGFGETNATVTQIESMQIWPNEPNQIWRRPARWQDELEPRKRADGNICNCRRVAPQ